MNLKKALSEKGKDRATLNLWIFGIAATIITYMMLIDGPADARLESEYAEFFETPCIKPWEKTLAREWGEDWINQVKQTIMDQSSDHPPDYRKAIYEVHRMDCSRLKKSGAVRDIAEVKKKARLSLARKRAKRAPVKTEVAIEKGADIDSSLNDDRFINPVVGLIRGDGYSCNSVSSIKVHSDTHPIRISVVCNMGRDKYKVRIDSGNIVQVAQL